MNFCELFKKTMNILKQEAYEHSMNKKIFSYEQLD